VDRASIGLSQGFVVRSALVSDDVISAEAGERVRAALARAVSVTERFRALASTYSDFASGQTELTAVYNELVTVTSNLAVDFGLDPETAERIAPIARFIFQVVEALRPFFSTGREAAISLSSLPLDTIGAMIGVVARITAYERGRSGLSTAQIFARAQATLAGAK
jgi:hypothetical protein